MRAIFTSDRKWTIFQERSIITIIIAINERGQEEQCEIMVDLVGVEVEEGDDDGLGAGLEGEM